MFNRKRFENDITTYMKENNINCSYIDTFWDDDYNLNVMIEIVNEKSGRNEHYIHYDTNEDDETTAFFYIKEILRMYIKQPKTGE